MWPTVLIFDNLISHFLYALRGVYTFGICSVWPSKWRNVAEIKTQTSRTSTSANFMCWIGDKASVEEESMLSWHTTVCRCRLAIHIWIWIG